MLDGSTFGDPSIDCVKMTSLSLPSSAVSSSVQTTPTSGRGWEIASLVLWKRGGSGDLSFQPFLLATSVIWGSKDGVKCHLTQSRGDPDPWSRAPYGRTSEGWRILSADAAPTSEVCRRQSRRDEFLHRLLLVSAE